MLALPVVSICFKSCNKLKKLSAPSKISYVSCVIGDPNHITNNSVIYQVENQ